MTTNQSLSATSKTDLRRLLPLVLLVVGVLAVLFAVYQYVGAANTLDTTPTLEELRDTLDLENSTNAQVMAFTESKRLSAISQQNRSLIIGGVGLAVIGAGWLLLDLGGRNPPPEAEKAAEDANQTS